jgi:hypothetical protein
MAPRKLVRHIPIFIYLACIPAFIWSDAPQANDSDSSSRHLRIGKPQAVYERFREGYALAQDARLKIPVWVQYELRPDDLDVGISRLILRFQRDHALKRPIIRAAATIKDTWHHRLT